MKRCKNCRQPLKTGSRYCSSACYQKARLGQKRGPYIGTHDVKVCPHCKGEFEVGGIGNPSRSRTFCSVRCARLARIERGGKALTLSRIDRAWLGGLFDGEGSIINVNRSTGGFTLRITLTSTCRPLLDHVLELTGVGTIVDNTRYDQDPRHAVAFHWQCYSENAKNLLRQMLPWLIAKQEKAIKAIAGETWERDRRWRPSTPSASTRAKTSS